MNPFNFALVAVILAMALVMACGPGAGSEPAAPSDDAVATDAPMTAPADEGRAGFVDGVQSGGPAMENSAKSSDSRRGSQPATAAPDKAAEAMPTIAVAAEPLPTATLSVSELAALAEANLPANTPTPESAPGSTQETVQETRPEPEATAQPERRIAEGPLAAEPVGIDAWINSEPLTLEQLRGKVALVDFWTYTCVNCIRTFPYLKLWHSRYADDGLVILGIHTPEFEFEKDYGNVLEATRENGIPLAGGPGQ